jgi:large subunit ribosomal protein L10
LKKEKKEEIVAELHQRLAKAKAVFVTDFRGLNVESLNFLRRELRRGGDEYQVVKKTLFNRASQETPLASLEDLFVGPCGVTLSYQDPVASAKTLAQFAKDKEGFVFKGGVLEGKPLSGEAVMQLSKMPPREVLLGQVLSSLIAVPSNFVSTLSAVIQKFLLTLKALEEQKAQAS